MKRIVITGSTRGIGYGLAGEFLKRGCAVTVNGRSQEAVERAVEKLAGQFAADCVHGQPGDVSQAGDVQALWDAAAAQWGGVDIWINNAGLSAYYKPAWEIPDEQLASVVNTNLLGVMLGAKVAYNGMHAQGSGAIYNMYGFGSTGSMRGGQTIYGSTKYAVAYFTRSMLKEIPSGSPVLLCSLSPGMVTTDLLESAYEDPAEFEQAKRIFNIIADRVETVTPWMAEQILANRKQGMDIRWLTRARLLWRFASAPFVKRDLFSELPPD